MQQLCMRGAPICPYHCALGVHTRMQFARRDAQLSSVLLSIQA